MSSWHEERRADKVVDAEQRRQERLFEAKLRRDERRKDREEKRSDEAQSRRDKADRRRARASRREKSLTPENVYKRGTLALVTASALASLPAQIAHFASISLMLLPMPFALEGAAWVMQAGVAYADARKLPGWVRGMMRILSLSAAGYAAWINYDYGSHIAPAVGYGLAAVTLLGPLYFDVRQWVTTLTFDAAERKQRAQAKARAKHEKRRKKDHKQVVNLAEKLVSAAPFGTLMFEDAFTCAWEIKYGTRTPGMTPALHAEAHASRKALADAMDAANGSPVSTRSRLLELLHPDPVGRFVTPGKSQVVTDLSPSVKGAGEKPQKAARKQPPPHRRTKGDSVPFSPIAKNQHSHEARQRLAVNGHHH
ncbi:hypothetical protein [Streptomyces sp. NPDC003857]